MVQIATDNLRIPVPVGSEDVIFICRRPKAREISNFLNNRWRRGPRGKIVDRLYEARREFVDSVLIDVENVTWKTAAGETLPLNSSTQLSDRDRELWSEIMGEPVTGWKDLIPLNWKSAVAMQFEDALALSSEDEEGNSPGASSNS